MTPGTGNLLHSINDPSDLKKLRVEDLPGLCQEIRHFIIDVLSANPGHLGASLGAVEIAVAIHYIFHTPYDKVIWDVGHQAYAHKILTGRKEVFNTNRMYKGISGFPKMSESEFDAFGAGHSSTSLSAALGMGVSANLENKNDRHHVAVIGDGAMTGGMAMEALNNAGATKANLLVILNDNGIAIDQNVGAIKDYLADIVTSRTYNKIRDKIWLLMGGGTKYGKDSRAIVKQIGNALKLTILRKSNLFEAFNFRYFGPVDGHDVVRLTKLLNDLKDIPGPKLLHVITVKGKGYRQAEKEQTVYHAPGVFDRTTGEIREDKCYDQPPKYQTVFGRSIVELAEINPKIVAITPAMSSGCSLNFMMNKMPDRVFDVGIAEQHAVTFAAGLAASGHIPFCNIYSTFLQRAYDQTIPFHSIPFHSIPFHSIPFHSIPFHSIPFHSTHTHTHTHTHDVALQKLNVVFFLDRAGLVGEDGATHHGAFDLAYLRCVPNMTVAAPMNEEELRDMMYTAQLEGMGPISIRYPRGRGALLKWKTPFKKMEIGKGERTRDGNDLALVTIGHIGNSAFTASEILEKEGISVAHYNMRFLKPVDNELLHEIFKKFSLIITIEDGTIIGGLGSTLLEFMSDHGYNAKVKRLGIPDHFIEQGTIAELHHECGYDVEGIISAVHTLVS